MILLWSCVLLAALCNFWWQWAVRSRLDNIETQLERLRCDRVMDNAIIGQLVLHSLIPNEKQDNQP